jgi:hypothetical protein
MGPNWIHGTQNNPILDLVRATGTVTHDWNENQVAFGPDGKPLPEDFATENAEIVWSLIGDAFKYSNESSANIDPKISLMDYMKEHVEEKLQAHLKQEIARPDHMVYARCHYFASTS